MTYAFWFKRKTWRAFWIALRRARRDRKARNQLLRFVFSLSIFVAWLIYLGTIFRGFSLDFGRNGNLFIGTYLAGFTALALYPYISDYFERRRIEKTSPSVPSDLKREIFSEACLLATLLERLASESYLEKEIPPEIVVTTRRVLLDRLTTLGLRENLEPWLLDLLLAPDGHWTAEQKNRASPAYESFECLRWALGLGNLRDLTIIPKYSIDDARALVEVKKPESLHVLPSWDIRPERNASDRFFSRCWSELLARHEVASAAEEDVERALAIRSEIREAGYTGDYLVGFKTIPELDIPLLFQVTRRAFNRWQILSLLVSILSGEVSVKHLRLFFAQYFAPDDGSEEVSYEN